ncbi:unnamed protein product [Thlaspi arvense]|uniref:endo-polygalacturonase n=1 Tax=Thlaspi arvense TaxID=13288 RepID=A0AAU9SN03_THLAR|nr:unnamed protein product [Thlaspi arvense]
MAGLQRSTISFRRQGSSGIVWDDRLIAELNKQANEQKGDTHQQEEQAKLITSEGQEQTTGDGGIKPIRTGGGIERSRSHRNTGRVSPAVDPPSPRLSAFGCCSAFGSKPTGKKPVNQRKRLPKRRSSIILARLLLLLLLLVVFSLALTANANSFESLLQLPRRTRPRSERLLHVGNFGAKGNGFTDDTKAFADAWKTACSSKAKNRILVPENYTCLVRPIDLSGPCKARLTLQISGTIIAPGDPDAWEGLNPRKWLYFHGVSRLTVEGGGSVNGMGQEWWRRSCKHNHSNPCRGAPTALTFHKCKNMRFENLNVIDSQQMHIAFTSCRRVTVSGVKVIAPESSPNTDGIHISASRGIVIDNTTVSTGDDCVSIVKNSSQISISNIVCGPGHGISIGSIGKSKSWEEVKDVTVDTAFISDTANGVRIKTWQGGSGLVSKIIFRNISMNNVSNPIIIDQYYCDSKKPCANQVKNLCHFFLQCSSDTEPEICYKLKNLQTSAVTIEKISFVDVRGTSASKQAIKISCSDTSPCRNILLQDIDLEPLNDDSFTESFCWEANGSSSGQVYPPSCLSDHETSFLEQSVRAGITSVSYL